MKYTEEELTRIASNMRIIADNTGATWAGVWFECECGAFNIRSKCKGCGSTDMVKYYEPDPEEADAHSCYANEEYGDEGLYCSVCGRMTKHIDAIEADEAAKEDFDSSYYQENQDLRGF